MILSYHRLSFYLECPRCFWLDVNVGIKRPDTIFPSLPAGIDTQLKRYFDSFRGQQVLPPELTGALPGHLLPSQSTIEAWRDWKRGLRHRVSSADVELVGALDDCLVDNAGVHSPIDLKTRGYPPKPSTHTYYQNQMDFYTLLLEGAGYPTTRRAFLLFYHPIDMGPHSVISFTVTVHPLKTHPGTSQRLVQEALAILRCPVPANATSCGFCTWRQALSRWHKANMGTTQ